MIVSESVVPMAFGVHAMLKSVEGTYRNGRVEVSEVPPGVAEGPVIVTFLSPNHVDLRARGIDAAQAADLRARLRAFEQDWNDPAMDAYDAL